MVKDNFVIFLEQGEEIFQTIPPMSTIHSRRPEKKKKSCNVHPEMDMTTLVKQSAFMVKDNFVIFLEQGEEIFQTIPPMSTIHSRRPEKKKKSCNVHPEMDMTILFHYPLTFRSL